MTAITASCQSSLTSRGERSLGLCGRWVQPLARGASARCRSSLQAVLEKGSAAGARYHAIAEEGLPFREIAEVIGRRLNVPVVSKTPEEAAKHFGWFTQFAAIDAAASSAITRERRGGDRNSPG